MNVCQSSSRMHACVCVCVCVCVSLCVFVCQVFGFQPAATRLAIRKSALTLCFPLIFCFSPKISKPNYTEEVWNEYHVFECEQKVSVCERFRITKSVVAISLEKPPWSAVRVCVVCRSVCVCVCVLSDSERGLGGLLEPLPACRHLTVPPPPGMARREGQRRQHSSPRKTPVGSLCHSGSAANRMWVTTGQTLEVKSGPEEVNYSICVCVYKFWLSLLLLLQHTHSQCKAALSSCAPQLPPPTSATTKKKRKQEK